MIKKIISILFLTSLLFGLLSCQDFFSKSLALWAARSSFAIPSDISTAQALDYVNQALVNNDPILAASLTPILLNQAQAASGDPVLYSQLANAMVTTVLLSSNVGTAFNQTLAVLAGGFEETEAGLDAALEDIVASFSSVSFSAGDLLALQQIVDQPPDNLSALDLQAAAVGLIFMAMNDIGYFDDPETDFSALEDNSSFILGMALLGLIPEGTESPLSGFMDMFDN